MRLHPQKKTAAQEGWLMSSSWFQQYDKHAGRGGEERAGKKWVCQVARAEIFTGLRQENFIRQQISTGMLQCNSVQ